MVSVVTIGHLIDGHISKDEYKYNTYKNFILQEREQGRMSKKIDQVSWVLVSKLMEAHDEHDNDKFNEYGELIAHRLEINNNKRGAKIIRKRLDGNYRNEQMVTLD